MCRIRRADRANCAHTSCRLIASPGCGQHVTRRLLHAVWTQYLKTAAHTRLARGSIRLIIVYEARATALQQTKSTTRARVPPSTRQPSECDRRSIARSGVWREG